MIRIFRVLFIFCLGYITGVGTTVKKSEKNEKIIIKNKRNLKERIKSWLLL